MYQTAAPQICTLFLKPLGGEMGQDGKNLLQRPAHARNQEGICDSTHSACEKGPPYRKMLLFCHLRMSFNVECETKCKAKQIVTNTLISFLDVPKEERKNKPVLVFQANNSKRPVFLFSKGVLEGWDYRPACTTNSRNRLSTL